MRKVLYSNYSNSCMLTSSTTSSCQLSAVSCEDAARFAILRILFSITTDTSMEAETASEVETEEFSASNVLASALKHIDGLIDSVVENSCSPDSSESVAARVIRTATDLRLAIEDLNRLQERQHDDVEDDDVLQYNVPSETLQVIYHWMLTLIKVCVLVKWALNWRYC